MIIPDRAARVSSQPPVLVSTVFVNLSLAFLMAKVEATERAVSTENVIVFLFLLALQNALHYRTESESDHPKPKPRRQIYAR